MSRSATKIIRGAEATKRIENVAFEAAHRGLPLEEALAAVTAGYRAALGEDAVPAGEAKG